MKRKILLFYIVLFTSLSYAKNYTICGFVKDKQNGEALIGAYCFDSITFKGNTTNHYGFYSLTLAEGKVKIVTSYSGYKPEVKEFTLTKDTFINFSLEVLLKEIKEVVVNSNLPVHRQTIMGKTILSMKAIESIPSFVGIPDIMRAISYLPGVNVGKEGYSNIYIRGGDRGQNLILLDGVKLYNSNHVGGFVSLFNPHIVKQVEVYKGGFPARYGGRASSVIEVITKDGGTEKLNGKFQVGILNSGFIIETPIRNDLSCIFAARSSYYDLLTFPARKNFKQTRSGSYMSFTFFDINTKLTWRRTSENNFFISFYTGHDLQKTEEAQKSSFQATESMGSINIHNIGITLGQNRLVSPKIFTKNSVSFSNYSNVFSNYFKQYHHGIKEIESYRSFSRINDYTFQSRWEYYANAKHVLKTGIEISRYIVIPSLQTNYESLQDIYVKYDTTVGFRQPLKSWEYNYYLEEEYHLTEQVWINIGSRLTAYKCSDTTFYRAEPRFSLRWLITDIFSFKFNYTIMNQYNHVLVNNYYGFEREIWIAATKNLRPQHAKQTSIGFFYNKSFLNVSIESYYKIMNNLIEYRSPVDESVNLSNIETFITKNGIGETYGLELQISKRNNIHNTSLNYTLAWNNRKFAQLNEGKWFPFIYDRRHSISLSTSIVLTPNYTVNSNFVFASGSPITLPEAFIKRDVFFYEYYAYGKINNRRLPPYHRLDIAFVRTWNTKKNIKKHLTINIYNVYARKNPVIIYYDSNTGKLYKKSLFTIIPTISYEIEL